MESFACESVSHFSVFVSNDVLTTVFTWRRRYVKQVSDPIVFSENGFGRRIWYAGPNSSLCYVWLYGGTPAHRTVQYLLLWYRIHDVMTYEHWPVYWFTFRNRHTIICAEKNKRKKAKMSLFGKVVTRVFQLNLRNNVSNIRQRTCSVILKQSKHQYNTLSKQSLFETKGYLCSAFCTTVSINTAYR